MFLIKNLLVIKKNYWYCNYYYIWINLVNIFFYLLNCFGFGVLNLVYLIILLWFFYIKFSWILVDILYVYKKMLVFILYKSYEYLFC